MSEQENSIIVDTELDSKGFKAGSVELQKAVKSLSTKMNSLGPTFQKAISGNASAISSFKAKAKSLEDTISAIEEKMDKLAEKRVPTEDYQWLTNEIKKAEEELAKLNDKQLKLEALGVKESSKAWQSLQYDIELAKQKLEDYEGSQASMQENGTAFKMGSDTDEYAQLSASLDDAKANLEEMQDGFRTPPTGLLDALRNAEPLSEQLKNKFSSIFSSAKRVGGSVKSVLSAILHPIHNANVLLGKLTSGFAYVGKQALKFVGNMAKKAVAKLGSALKSAAQKMLTFKKSSGSTEGAITKLGKKLTGLVSMLKRMALRKIMSSMLQGLKDGMNNLAQYSSGVNANLSTLKSGLTQLKNSFATAFAPILSVVTPILSKLIGYLSTAVTYIGKLFAALTGAKTFTKAVAVQEDYAKSLDKTSKAAKKAEKQLASFDELNILSDKSSDSNSDGSISPSDMFEEVPIESSISGFANKIRAAIENGDWEGLGQLLGEKVNGIVQKVHDAISWDNVGPKVTEFINAFTTTFNSLVDTIDWALIGDTVAQGINTIVNSAYLLIDGIDWESLGSAMADGLSGLINGVDWKKLSETVTLSLSAIGDSVNGFATSFDWKGAADSVNNLFAGFDLDKATTDITNGLNKAISGLRTTLQEIDWIAIGKTFADGINGIFKLDWSNIGGLLSDGVDGIWDTLNSTIKNIEWKKLGGSIAEFIQGIEWSELFKDLGETIGNSLIGVIDIVSGFLQDMDWSKAMSDLWDSIVGFVEGIDWSDLVRSIFEIIGSAIGAYFQALDGYYDKIAEIFSNIWQSIKDWFNKYADWGDTPGNIIAGLWEGIKDAFSNAGKWIKEYIFQPFIDGFKNAFGIHSPSTVMAEMAGYLIDGLKNGIGDIWEKVKENFLNLLQGIKDWFADKKDDLTKAWNGFTSGIKDKTATITATVKNSLGKVGETIKGYWNTVKTKTSTLTGVAKDNAAKVAGTLKGYWSKVYTKTATLTGAAKDSAAKVAGVLKGYWSKVYTKTAMLTGKAKDSAAKTVSTLKSYWSSIYSKTSTLTAKAVENGKTKLATIKSWWNGIKSKTETLSLSFSDKVSSAIRSVVNSIVGFINNLIDKLNKVPGVNINHIQYPNWTYLAKGGVVDRPTLAMIGEAGKEAVVPLENNTGWIKKMAQAISSEIQMHTYSFGEVKMSSAFDKTLDAFANKIDGSLNSMADRIQAIADRVTFTMPVVAQGIVVPYSVSASTASSDNDISNTIETSNQELGSVIIQTVTNATSAIVTAIENYSGTKINLDMESLTTGVINETNRRTRISGKSQLLV